MLVQKATCGVMLLAMAAGCGHDDSDDVLATVDGDAITFDELALSEDSATLVRVSNDPGQSQLQTALDRAIRDELLAREAVRRGHSGATRASLLGALVAEERRSNPELLPSTISSADAREWYEANRELFEHVVTANAYWAEVESKAAGQELFEASLGVSSSEFQQIVERSAELVDHGSGKINADDDSVNAMLLRIANAVRESGHVGMDQDRVNGHWWVVRVEDVTLHSRSWDADLELKVKTAMAWSREQDHLDRLAAHLSAQWPVEVNEDLVASMADGEEGR